MDNLFLTILNMSLTGAFIIAVISLVRLPLKKTPKIISYCLWAVAAFRLVIPISAGSMFSLIPFRAQVIPPDIGFQQKPQITSGISYFNHVVSDMLPAAAPQTSVNPLQIWITVGRSIWMIGALGLLIYGILSYFKLKTDLKEAVLLHSNIYESESVSSPFVLGFVKPNIYLPVGLSENEHRYIILHEQTHIRRHDHIVKLAAYGILCLHWFNPLVWMAYLLMGADMEMSCDECVLKELGSEVKKDYTYSMLSLAADRRIMGRSPLAFSEGGIKERIKNVLNFKKPTRMIVFVSTAAVIILSIGFVVNQTMERSGTEAGAETAAGNPAGMPGEGFRLMETARTYYLEQLTERQKFQHLSSVILYDSGKAVLATPPISSYLMPECTYVIAENELILYANIDTDEQEDFFGVQHGSEIARFQINDDVLTFQSAAVPVFAEKGMQYVLTRTLPVPVSNFKPRQWIVDNSSEQEFWESTNIQTLEEFPNLVFHWSSDTVTVTNHDMTFNAADHEVLISGMPIWNVYFADLNGDNLPEFCANISIGSGIVDERIIICDVANDKTYDLSDRAVYDYSLSLENGQLLITQRDYNSDIVQAVGSMAIIDDELVLFGIERADSVSPIFSGVDLE